MRQGKISDGRRSYPNMIAAGVTVALLSLPAFGQRATGAPAPAIGIGRPSVGSPGAGSTGAGSTGISRPAVGRPGATRPNAPASRPAGSLGRGTPFNRGTARSNILGPNSSAPRPTSELPKNVTPQWEIPSYNNVQPNYVQGNPVNRARGGYGAGYGVGYGAFLPYYADSTAFVDAGGSADDTAQQAQPNSPARAAYEGQDPCGEAGCPPQDGFYPPPPANRQPEERRQPTAAESAAAQSNGLDHPEVTLVFNDGRPAKKVRNYVLTSSAVFISENGHQTTIPVADLDMQATVSQNRDAGVDFTLPGSR